ncbi:ABC transporter substrate-binding protein [Desulfofundulus thermocisternus]|uniref:ABC transporter substrate-binding protein n=1 Tax=Desulfofundulus thermocisternus TaxID=42471 RepID=UPI000A49BA5B|nr:ABC transporter substrate-binding protein [Desulfofundulus thermocisternus]
MLFEAVGEREVKFTFTQPEPAFPAKVAYHGCPIFSSQSFDAEGRIVHPYGTGPFKFADYKKGEALVVVRNDDYWGGKPKLEKVIFKVIPDPSTRLAALQTGEIQAVADVGGILPEQARVIKGDSNLVLLSRPVTTTHYLLFNNKKPPFNDVHLRQAVSLAIDRAQMVKEVLNGYGEPADTIFTSLARSWVVKGLWTTDKNKARELAAQVKAGTPRKVVFIVNSALANRWPYKTMAEIMQSELKALGFEVELKILEMGAWKEVVKKGEYDLTLTPYTLMTGDPDFFFGRWIHSNGQMNVQRGVGYNNPEADRLVELAAAEREPAKYARTYVQVGHFCASCGGVVHPPEIVHLGHDLELIVAPGAYRVGDEVILEVRYRGRPLAGAIVKATWSLREEEDWALAQKTDDAGWVKFTLSHPGHWLFYTRYADETRKSEGEYDKRVYSATLSFFGVR